MTRFEAENLLGQAVALNIIAETCSLFDKCCCDETICPYWELETGNCILLHSVQDKFEHVKIMEKRALEVLNKGEKKQ